MDDQCDFDGCNEDDDDDDDDDDNNDTDYGLNSGDGCVNDINI